MLVEFIYRRGEEGIDWLIDCLIVRLGIDPLMS